MSLFSFIKQQVPIMDEVSRYVQLKMAGTYYKGPCPFHRETDASFTVSPDKQIFYCFGCHVSGDVVSFVAKAENLSPIEAARYLIESHGITVPDSIANQAASAGKKADEKASYFVLCKQVTTWAQQQLQHGKAARTYVDSRGITPEIVQRFGIGYIPGGPKALQALAKHCAQENILVKDLIEAGIFFESRNTLRSPFEERIVFPITDALGRNCGFGGRVFVKNDERAKYYNSKESPFFVKGTLLFGYALAKKAMQEAKAVFLVEGYTDCVAMAQYGYQNVVATLGTACTKDHLQLLARSCDRVYVLYDGDSAGHKAMMRLAQLCWQVNLELCVISLPGGLDPASYLAQHTVLDQPIAQAQDIFTFFVQATAGDFAAKSLAEKMKAVGSILDIISRLSDVVKREVLLQQASEALGVPVDVLRLQVKEKGAAPQLQAVKQPSHKKDDEAEGQRLQAQIVALSINSVLQDEQLVVPEEVYPYLAAGYVRILKALATVRSSQTGQACFDALLATVGEKEREWIMSRTMKYSGTVGIQEFASLVGKVVQSEWKEMVGRIRGAIEHASQQGDVAKVQELLASFAELKKQMQEKGLMQWQKHQNN